MDKQQHIGGGGAKVTYIETQFVTSDAAGFKDLVQRLTGRFPTGASSSSGAAQAARVARRRGRQDNHRCRRWVASLPLPAGGRSAPGRRR
ncbi:hypothetical protein BAE44_0008050 [Dichanthelium oligosanthes]|uniref:VQ domain-containing protein n=1 Tax=Dichanthelium oligosanthes TaxID=888268 RepID=A0A1E5W0R8_9POAL|nr:hypothetical protein BAE44_0008050 [Dichanthelium oligosanthes]